MNRYQFRELLECSDEELWALPEERHTVIFDDGELTTHTRATILSVYLCHPLRAYSAVPLKSSYHLEVQSHLTGDLITSLVNVIIWDIFDYHTDINPEDLATVAFDTINRFYNMVTTRLSRYSATLSMFDLLEVMDDPDIQAVNAQVEPNQYSIEDVVYPQLKQIMLDSDKLKGNALAEAAKAGTLSMGQLLQCIGPRGFLTDINSDIFSEPITTGYAQGIYGLYENLIESRSGVKALLFNSDFLPETELFNRKNQLITQYIKNVHPGDCKGETINWHVTKRNLPRLKGQYYLDDEGNLDWFRGNETHLIDKTVRKRSVLGCIHPDSQGICATCFGRLADSIPAGSNIGHISAVQAGDKITSGVLTTKHLDTTSRVDKFQLRQTEKQYLQYGKEPETLELLPELAGKPMWITVAESELASLSSVLYDDIKRISPARISMLTKIQITVDHGGKRGMVNDLLEVSLYNRKASFTRELLFHIRTKQWVQNGNKTCTIDLTDFPAGKPLLTLPFKHVNMYENMRDIRTFLHSATDNDKKVIPGESKIRKTNRRNFLRSYRNPVSALEELFFKLNEKLKINVVHCEMLLYAMMIRSKAENDYRLPKPGLSGEFSDYNSITSNRSLAGLMAFQNQARAFEVTSTFMPRPIPDHPYDWLLMGGDMNPV